MKIGDKLIINAQEWTVVANTIGGKKMWIGKLWGFTWDDKYIEYNLIDADLNGKTTLPSTVWKDN